MLSIIRAIKQKFVVAINEEIQTTIKLLDQEYDNIFKKLQFKDKGIEEYSKLTQYICLYGKPVVFTTSIDDQEFKIGDDEQGQS